VQQEPGERLVHLVVEIAGDPGALVLLGVEGGACRPPALGLEPFEHAPEGDLEARNLLGLGAPVRRSPEVRPGAREVGALHRFDQPLERGESSREEQHVEEHRRCDRDRQDHQRGREAEVVAAREQARGADRERDHDEVGNQHLGQESARSHRPPSVDIEDASPGARCAGIGS
jgi:hypothetical protein